jgi:hypothetical protein
MMNGTAELTFRPFQGEADYSLGTDIWYRKPMA